MSLTFVAYHDPEPPTIVEPPDDLPPMPDYLGGYNGPGDDEPEYAATSDYGIAVAVGGAVAIALLAILIENLFR